MSQVQLRGGVIYRTLGAALVLALLSGCPRKKADAADAEADAAAVQVDAVPAQADAAPGAQPQQAAAHAEAGVVVPAKPAAAKSCPAGEILLVADRTFCARPCSTDAECGLGTTCGGTAIILQPSGAPGNSVRHCIAKTDAGAKADAAAPALQAADAGLRLQRRP